MSANDGWAQKEADSAVKGTVELKYKQDDAKDDVYGPLYYIVTLEEKIRHFFLPGWFDDMDAPVKAVVLLQPHNEGLITPIQQLEREMVINNWETTNQYKDKDTGLSVSGGKWNHYMSGTTDNNTGVSYSTGNSYRTESIRVTTSNDRNKSDGQSTAANGGKFYGVKEVDSINIDFQAEVRVNTPKFTTDWDLDYSSYTSLPIFKEYTHVDKNNSWGINNGDDKRILFNVEFNEAFPTRYPNREADILWTRIESDPIKNPYADARVTIFNSVRQITLNFNTDNTKKAANGNYEKRPYFIFYTGPEHIDYKTDSNGVLIRHSQPVVINLNADLNAILYMPESPVIINGNGHAWHGFVIARCFLKSLTSDEMTNNGTVELYDGFNKPDNHNGYNKSYTFKGDYTKGLDGKGQYVYYHDDDHLTTKEAIDTAYKDDTIIADWTTDNIIVKEHIDAPKYPVISFTKDLYKDCTTIEQYFAKTAEYITDNYTKEKYAKFAGIDESEVSMIKFPEEKETLRNSSGVITHNYDNFTAIEIPVATADLLDEDPDPDVATKDNKYVKVMLGDEEKYILKSKLPHVRVKYNAVYPYVCIYDLKTGLGWELESAFVCVKPMDISTDTSDAAIVFANSKVKTVPGSNQWGDVWVVERQLLEQTYKNNYQANKLEYGDENGIKFFMLKSEVTPANPQIFAKYHKITLLDDKGEVLKDDTGNPVVKYLPDDDDKDIQYYTQVQNNANNPDNYIIVVDKKGNMLTKALTAPEIFEVKDDLKISDEEPADTDEDDGINDREKNDSVESKIASGDYYKYTRKPKVPPEGSGDLREQPYDPGTVTDAGKYRGKDFDNLKKRDYRIPVFERVYQAEEAFGLNKESYYSYFQIPELWRVNYCYLDVNENKNPPTVYRYDVPDGKDYWKVEDMFFTKVRAKWID